MKRTFEVIGIIIALAALIVGLLNWLSPFNPVGNSPINNDSSSDGQPAQPVQQNSTPAPIVIVVTATSQAEQPSAPIATQVISIPTVESLSSCPSFQAGEKRKVTAGTFVLGDVVIDGVKQYTDNIGEGTISFFENDSSEVSTPYGAGCFLGSKSLIDQVIQDELQHGCGSRCSSIRFVNVYSVGNQVVEMYPK